MVFLDRIIRLEPKWGEWSRWSACTGHKTCGPVQERFRMRVCIDIATGKRMDGYCRGSNQGHKKCKKVHCPVDGKWGRWQPWGRCSVDCGKPDDGVKKRTRICNSPTPKYGGKKCSGKSKDESPCAELHPCKVDCKYSYWGEWSKCPITCGTLYETKSHVVTRRRHIEVHPAHDGAPCSGVVQDTKSCHHCDEEKLRRKDKKVCLKECPVDCLFTQWNEWSTPCDQCYKRTHPEIERFRSRYVSRQMSGGGKHCKTKKKKVLLVGTYT